MTLISINIIWTLLMVSAFIVGAFLSKLYYSVKIKTLSQETLTDPLTGLYNYKEFSKRFSQETARSARSQNSFALLLIDIDHFKALNTAYGYKNADILMLQLIELVKTELRQTDTLFRYRNGDEFAIIATNTNCAGAQTISERIQKKVNTFPFILKEKNIPMSVSIGFASYETHKANLEAEATVALTNAKQKSLN